MSVPVDIKTEEVILESTEYNSAEELDEELQLQLEDSGGEYIQYQAEPQIPQRQRHTNSGMNTSSASIKSGGSGGGGSTTPNGSATNSGNKNLLESEKRMRREIANSNERRRMQSINAGFQNLRSLLPRHEGDKLSKAAILQQTSQYIYELENQKTQLLNQNSQLKRQLGLHESNTAGSSATGTVESSAASGAESLNSGSGAIKKRKLTDNIISLQTISDSSDEGLGSMSPEPTTLLNVGVGSVNAKSQVIIAHNAATSKELSEMKKQLEKERRMRTMLEEELQMIKRQLYSVATAPAASTSSYIPREVIEHTDNLVRESIDELPAGTVSYVEIDEMTGQRQVVVCSSIEELESEAAAAAAEIITEDNVQEEVILSSTSSTESEQEVNAIAKAYAEGSSPSAAVLQPILQAAIKATPKVEVERIHEIIKVKTEKIDQPSGLTRSRQNLETIVEAIRHLEGDHLFADGSEQKLQQQQNQRAQEAPLALTTKVQHAQRATLAELRPYLQIKGNKQVTILQQTGQQKDSGTGSIGTTTVMPTAIYKVQTTAAGSSSVGAGQGAQQVTITTTALKQVRPGVIVAKQLS
ncbi:PREDICTED: helix-loop-helix protein 11 [Rhagoletis zephyria]|uniref:helix-loop-helix protein 11 n=1 Tax=Rhagoletis zephyria TaxID=28612 RepID=UPI000811351B|nr:PREDICTED: helix-loop-helix protein 11 [Rhagoletis zephyria]XP_036327785.1 helix-loop-helix protein 11 [Rhagoletis pomonella]